MSDRPIAISRALTPLRPETCVSEMFAQPSLGLLVKCFPEFPDAVVTSPQECSRFAPMLDPFRSPERKTCRSLGNRVTFLPVRI